MKRVPVDSSAVKAIGYDPATKTLEVAFPRGAVVAHVDVPPEVFEKLMAAKSVGQYYNAYVRAQFPFSYVEDD